MKTIFLTLFLFSISTCKNHNEVRNSVKNNINQNLSKLKIDNENFISKKLRGLLNINKIKPITVIHSNEINTQLEILLENHKIKWFNNNFQTKIKIDGTLFFLKDIVTINKVNNKKDRLIGNLYWNEIKLFKYNNRELIGITIGINNCNGSLCSLFYFLIYDVKTKTINFFGSFRMESELELFDYNNDGNIEYISTTYKGNPNGTKPIEFIYNLYSINNKGQFLILNDQMNNKYQITYTTFPYDTSKLENLKENWIIKIK